VSGPHSVIRPTGVERRFGTEEIIVTKTDPRGVIRYANDVFLRVAGYRAEEVLGRPHNIIRHPDMPRAVFRLLWNEIQAGREIFAYVLNLASDGSHYWVLAHVTPSHDDAGRITGYHSSRRCAQARPVQTLTAVYRTLLDVERGHAGATEAADAGYQALTELLTEHHLTYSQFVWSLISDRPARAA